MRPDPQNLLARAIVGLEADALPDDVSAWLLEGLRRFRAGEGGLDTCLSLRPMPGKRSVAMTCALNRRDGLICAMGFVLPGNATERAAAIADIIAGRTPAARGLVGELAMLLHGIGAPMPESSIQIWRILKGNRSF